MVKISQKEKELHLMEKELNLKAIKSLEMISDLRDTRARLARTDLRFEDEKEHRIKAGEARLKIAMLKDMGP